MITLGLISLIIACVLLGQPLFVMVGLITAYCYHFIGQSPLSGIVEDIFFAGDKEILLAIPLFVLAGNMMTQGSIARRLIRVASALTASIPSGLAIAGVLSCGVFAAISGSSPVTLIAIGGVMYPALIKAGYKKEFTIGLMSAGGTLGIIIPPSVPMIIYAIMVGVSVTDLFLAGVIPGVLIMFFLVGYSVFRGKGVSGTWSTVEFVQAMKEGTLSLLMPAIILGGIYTGFFTATESAAVAVAYAFVVELFIHREIGLKHLPKILYQSAEMLGTLFLILVLAVSLNKFMTYQEIPEMMVQKLSSVISSQFGFLIGVNILLLIVGCLMDIMSAILVLAPLLAPMAVHYGVHPIHFGILMIVNLEIGYLTPPVGVNLFVASSIFKESLGTVIRSAMPLVATMIVALGVITFVPKLSLFFVKETKKVELGTGAEASAPSQSGN